ncbi:hypothetical protein LSCM4_04686 [Leishmania orientalis]|uniref:Uncharacterized protein n=1 Tax=Leishmania orientalis TaxID=2249476 RepID=A0A836HKS2_9TRYP|nr:hypothetical protein LSCM4_04686 [Leishmania orientalis]
MRHRQEPRAGQDRKLRCASRPARLRPNSARRRSGLRSLPKSANLNEARPQYTTR